ncbi:methanol dehydrogenase [Microbulbifer flavimaris]|uniref:Methanol dehydrogenase n=1 Tax=Microbulbifer flavimaris TaxID=1781068 RepID=A0ABX4I1Y1_9GAMM|nr:MULTISPECIES: TPM domain-containing protein [Microbulbifer]KUJ84350.1 methanol dehydrogenase [Microbulbifer sp. ZGT114]PCO06432.1 methanol dehydrogenase [Microbulbifer flavimaris]
MPRRITAAILGLLAALCVAIALADLQFPTLSGRVVDDANLLSPATEYRLTELAQAHEKETSNQVVVVTVPDLQGQTIAEYGYQLGRHWGIGQEGKDNGVLLIVAPSERQVRIEVGYGLEGVLTDALSANIIHTKILPRFRNGDFDGGVIAGAESILAAIRNEYVAEPTETETDRRMAILVGLFLLLIMLQLFGGSLLGPPSSRGTYRRGRYGGYYGGGGFGGGFGGGGFGGGFGGGGGGFGGGGASGGW